MKTSFYKLKKYGVLSGVCAGIADKYNWDIVVVRILTFLLCWFWRPGIIVYIVLSIILPEKSLENSQTSNSNTYNNSNTFDADYDIKEESGTE